MKPSDVAPARRVHVTLAAREWEMVPTDKLTWPEAKEVKRVSGGLSVGELEKGLQSADPDAWFAWLFVSIRRQWPTLTEAELEAAIGDTPIAAVISTVKLEVPEVAGLDGPPVPAPNSGADEQSNGNGSSEKTQPVTTLATSGIPPSPTPI